MEKMEFKSKDIVSDNVEKISNLFPNVVSEGKIDFEKLRQELTNDLIEGDESYDFTWVGKKNSVIEANTPTTKTLRPCIEESESFDTTENLYIEGDNLEVLKILQKSYFGKIKCIYIDPPYNTGIDFIYNDDFKMNTDEYIDKSGEIDDEGNRLFKNTDSNGRFHSDWCSMIYSRLKLAYNLLCDDGLIFISIDEHEQCNLKKICDEIYGLNNFISCFIWQKKKGGGQAKYFYEGHEYILIYSKNKFKIGKLLVNDDSDYSGKNYMIKDNKVFYINDDIIRVVFGKYKAGTERRCHYEDILQLKGKDKLNEVDEKIKTGEYILRKSDSDPNKHYVCRLEDVSDGKTKIVYSIISGIRTEDGNNEMEELRIDFDTPKPTELIKLIINLSQQKESLVMDFFSGSATTAHAVMKLNAEDGGKRKFIMVQLPEETNEDSEAYKAGFKNICEIGKERIRRAGKKILEENKDKEGIKNLDTGFRVLKLSDSNMKDVYYNPDDYSQDLISKLTSNIKDDRTEDDLLFASLLDRGIDISKSYRKVDIDGKKVIIYNEEGEVPEFIACFDENITEKCVTEIAKMKPLKATFRDSSFGSSSDRINVEEIFKLYSKDTRVSVM